MAEIQSILRRISDEIEKRGERKELITKNSQIRMEKLLFMDMETWGMS